MLVDCSWGAREVQIAANRKPLCCYLPSQKMPANGPGGQWTSRDFARLRRRRNNVLRLRRSLYGLCQSPLNYYKLVTEVYLAAGLTQCKADECVFVRFENNIKGGPKTMSI